MINYRKIIYKGLIITSVCILSFSCEDKYTYDDDFVFPLKVGNEWNYKKTLSTISYTDNNGIKINLDTLTIVSDVSLMITNKMLLSDSIEAYEMRSTEKPRNSYSDSSTGYSYYNNLIDGLYRMGYIAAPGGGMITPKINYRGDIANNINDMLSYSDFFKAYKNSNILNTDSIYVEDPPFKSIPYPVEIGYEWLPSGTDYTIFKKEIIDKTQINVTAGTFVCYVVKWSYSISDDLHIYDYFNKNGLILRRIEALENYLTDEIGMTIGMFDSITEYELINYNLK